MLSISYCDQRDQCVSVITALVLSAYSELGEGEVMPGKCSEVYAEIGGGTIDTKSCEYTVPLDLLSNSVSTY